MRKRDKTVVKDLTQYDRHQLEEAYVQLSDQVEELAAKIAWYENQLRLSRHQKFGASSEKTDISQLNFFNEPEMEADPSAEEPVLEKIRKPGVRRKGNKEIITADLPVEVIEYKLSADEQKCPQCGEMLHEMSKEIRKELTVVPAKVVVTEHVRYVYTCRNCQKNGSANKDSSVPVITAPMPRPVIKNSLASPSLISYIMNRKYAEGIPLYRQEQQLDHYGLEIKRQNMANWIIYSSEHYLRFLYERLKSRLVTEGVLHADETALQVLQEPGRAAETKSYMWMYRTGQDQTPIILYEYQPDRAGEHPKEFLRGFSGYLHVDGYPGYHKVEGVTLVGCWAHARRKYDEALKALSGVEKIQKTHSAKGLELCNQLFSLEKKFESLTPVKREKKRLSESLPLVDAYFVWAKELYPCALPESPLGKALYYSLNQEEKLRAFLLDGRLELSNNLGERAIKPFVIGRKNWLFANSQKGAAASAVMYSIMETAKANKLNPYEYLKYLLEQLPNLDLEDPYAVDKLLPWNKGLPDICRTKKS